MSDFNPAEQFRKFHPEEAAELALQSESKWFRVSLEYTLSEMAFSGANAEELSGARRIINGLLQLSIVPLERPKYPPKHLTELGESESF
jgi:hypothetical protein